MNRRHRVLLLPDFSGDREFPTSQDQTEDNETGGDVLPGGVNVNFQIGNNANIDLSSEKERVHFSQECKWHYSSSSSVLDALASRITRSSQSKGRRRYTTSKCIRDNSRFKTCAYETCLNVSPRLHSLPAS
jgi:hypothetical protein